MNKKDTVVFIAGFVLAFACYGVEAKTTKCTVLTSKKKAAVLDCEKNSPKMEVENIPATQRDRGFYPA